MENTNQNPVPLPQKPHSPTNKVFVGLFAAGILVGSLATYILLQYRPTIELTALQNQKNSNQQQPQATSTIPAAPTDPDILASQTVVLKPDFTFTLPEYPNVEFKILKVIKATGAISTRGCQMPSIYIKYIGGSSPGGTCIPGDTMVEDQNPAAVAIDFETVNNSNTYAINRMLKLTYYVNDNGQQELRYAQENPPWDSYGSSEYSSNTIRLGFVIPENQDNFELLYGTFGRASGGNYYNDPIEGVNGAIKIDFSQKTFEKETPPNINNIQQ